jgi:hypothetical protein
MQALLRGNPDRPAEEELAVLEVEQAVAPLVLDGPMASGQPFPERRRVSDRPPDLVARRGDLDAVRDEGDREGIPRIALPGAKRYAAVRDREVAGIESGPRTRTVTSTR